MVATPKRWWDKPIEPAAALVHPARHPIQVCLVLGLLIAGVFQLVQPEPVRSAVLMSHEMYILTGFALTFGSVLLLLSALTAIRHPWLSMGLSLSGMLATAGVLAYYVDLSARLPHWQWLSMIGFWFIGSMFAGFLVRAVQLIALTVKIYFKTGVQ